MEIKHSFSLIVVVLIFGLVAFVLAGRVADSKVGAIELQAEEQLLVNMLDKVRKRGFDAYQTAGHLIQFVITFYQSGKYEVAIAECEKVMQQYPNDVRKLYSSFKWKQRSLLCLGQIEEARAMPEEYQGDLRYVPFRSGYDGPLYLYLKQVTAENLASFYRGAGNFEQATREYSEVIRLAKRTVAEIGPVAANAKIAGLRVSYFCVSRRFVHGLSDDNAELFSLVAVSSCRVCGERQRLWWKLVLVPHLCGLVS